MATTSEQYINSMYDKQKENTLNGLKSAYEQNVNTLDSAAAKVPQQYYDQKREAEGNAEIQRRNMNEIFNANGLNTGAIGQYALAMANQKSANLATLNKAQADAEAEIALQRTQLETEYKNAVQGAIANSDFNRAQALYTAYQQQQADAKSQVDALIKAGVMPNDELIATSGYNPSYVQSLYNAAIAAKQTASYSGVRRDTKTDDDETFKPTGGTYTPYVAGTTMTSAQLAEGQKRRGTTASSSASPQFSSTASGKAKSDYYTSYKNGDITYQQYIRLMDAERNNKR